MSGPPPLHRGAAARAQRARELERLREQLRDAERRGAALAASVEDYKAQARDYADRITRLEAELAATHGALEVLQAELCREREQTNVARRCKAQLHDLLEALDLVEIDPELLHDHSGG